MYGCPVNEIPCYLGCMLGLLMCGSSRVGTCSIFGPSIAVIIHSHLIVLISGPRGVIYNCMKALWVATYLACTMQEVNGSNCHYIQKP